MKLRTKIAVKYNQGPAGSANGIIEGVLISAGWLNNPETNVFDRIGVNYSYSIGGVNLYTDGLVIEGDVEIQKLYDALKTSIPSGLDYVKQQQTIFYLAFIGKMAQTFSVDPSDIELINN
jgi:hypothetical protein